MTICGGVRAYLMSEYEYELEVEREGSEAAKHPGYACEDALYLMRAMNGFERTVTCYVEALTDDWSAVVTDFVAKFPFRYDFKSSYVVPSAALYHIR